MWCLCVYVYSRAIVHMNSMKPVDMFTFKSSPGSIYQGDLSPACSTFGKGLKTIPHLVKLCKRNY